MDEVFCDFLGLPYHAAFGPFCGHVDGSDTVESKHEIEIIGYGFAGVTSDEFPVEMVYGLIIVFYQVVLCLTAKGRGVEGSLFSH